MTENLYYNNFIASGTVEPEVSGVTPGLDKNRLLSFSENFTVIEKIGNCVRCMAVDSLPINFIENIVYYTPSGIKSVTML